MASSNRHTFEYTSRIWSKRKNSLGLFDSKPFSRGEFLGQGGNGSVYRYIDEKSSPIAIKKITFDLSESVKSLQTKENKLREKNNSKAIIAKQMQKEIRNRIKNLFRRVEKEVHFNRDSLGYSELSIELLDFKKNHAIKIDGASFLKKLSAITFNYNDPNHNIVFNFYVAMPLLPQSVRETYLTEEPKPEHQLKNFLEILDLYISILESVDMFHRRNKTAHLDLHRGNLCIYKNSNAFSATIFDFGFAKKLGVRSFRRFQSYWTDPELTKSYVETDGIIITAALDVYSLGVMIDKIFELIPGWKHYNFEKDDFYHKCEKPLKSLATQMKDSKDRISLSAAITISKDLRKSCASELNSLEDSDKKISEAPLMKDKWAPPLKELSLKKPHEEIYVDNNPFQLSKDIVKQNNGSEPTAPLQKPELAPAVEDKKETPPEAPLPQIAKSSLSERIVNGWNSLPWWAKALIASLAITALVAIACTLIGLVVECITGVTVTGALAFSTAGAFISGSLSSAWATAVGAMTYLGSAFVASISTFGLIRRFCQPKRIIEENQRDDVVENSTNPFTSTHAKIASDIPIGAHPAAENNQTTNNPVQTPKTVIPSPERRPSLA